MNKSNRKPRNELMYEAILSLKDKDECMRFFDDLCTVTELQAMEQRFQVALLLYKGNIYNDILSQTGASSATISRVKRSLEYGHGGYSPVFDRITRPAEPEVLELPEALETPETSEVPAVPVVSEMPVVEETPGMAETPVVAENPEE